MNIVLKSYKKIDLAKAIKPAPAGKYIIRHQDPAHTILWAGEKGQGSSHIVDTTNFLASLDRGFAKYYE